MTAGETGSSLLFRYKIHLHLPGSKTNLLFYKEWLGRSMEVMTHPAVPALIPIHMQEVKILFLIPKTGTIFRFLGIHKVGIVTKKAKFKILCACTYIVLLWKTVHKEGTKIRAMSLVTRHAPSTRDSRMHHHVSLYKTPDIKGFC